MGEREPQSVRKGGLKDVPEKTLFPDDADETRTEILRATYRALCEHGYADLTIERIGEHFEKSTSLIYHHYDGKDDLLLDFLTYLLEDFEARQDVGTEADPSERLDGLLDWALSPPPDEEAAAFRDAITELRAQAVSDDAYRRHFEEHDELLTAGIETIVAEGIEEGVFREVDPAAVAETIHTILSGALLQGATTTTFDPAAVREELQRYVDGRLIPKGQYP